MYARDLLFTNEFPSGRLAEVAALTLIGATDLGVPPRRTAEALWRFICERPDSEWARRAADTVGKLSFEADVMSEAVNIVRMRDTPASWFELALEVLSGTSYAPKVTSEIILAAAERAIDPYACFLVNELVGAAHRCGSIPAAVITAVMNGWGAGTDARRERALDLAMLLTSADVGWLTRMLADMNVTVRRKQRER